MENISTNTRYHCFIVYGLKLPLCFRFAVILLIWTLCDISIITDCYDDLTAKSIEPITTMLQRANHNQNNEPTRKMIWRNQRKKKRTRSILEKRVFIKWNSNRLIILSTLQTYVKCFIKRFFFSLQIALHNAPIIWITMASIELAQNEKRKKNRWQWKAKKNEKISYMNDREWNRYTMVTMLKTIASHRQYHETWDLSEWQIYIWLKMC